MAKNSKAAKIREYLGEHPEAKAADVVAALKSREVEVWPLAVGLDVGDKLPVVMMQTTGMFESGDASSMPGVILTR